MLPVDDKFSLIYDLPGHKNLKTKGIRKRWLASRLGAVWYSSGWQCFFRIYEEY
ncbi:hypothetical protein ARMSODRAFT_953748 [Armillaria solidipes]|uniref:Uncharacterized protein n=1 Tax=Armillaria solidipes TaxID=1076256 RepID=A0A2H3BMG0_9AGAR|nr:hypothetical protein ARMSODRAFT_953748 [Armillaria solidipes]